MLKSTENRINAAIQNYLNGNLKDAGDQIRAMTKAQIAQMLVEHHLTDVGRVFIGRPNERYEFEQFVVRALLGWQE